MNKRYQYQKRLRRSRYAEFRRLALGSLGLALLAGGLAFYIYGGLRGLPSKPKVSALQDTQISSPMTTFTSPYFQFQDTGKWVFDKADSTPNKFIYTKYNGQEIEHQLIIYVNQVPIPLDLATPRVLPVRIVNDNSFEVTGVSDPCSNQYAPGEPHRVEELAINGADMLCDPDNSQYFVVVSQIGGNYQLPLKRANGAAIQLVITYKDVGLDAQPDSLMNIASSFKTI